VTRRAVLLFAVTLAIAAPAAAADPEQPLSLAEATRLALRRNDAIAIGRESLAAARATERAARGAYDPVLSVDAGWSRASQPVNAAAPGAAGLAPERESSGGGAAVTQLLPTGGTLSVRASGERSTSGAADAQLSPAYDTRAGAELRQPLLRGLGMDAARLSVRAARADLRGADAGLARARIETVAAVERAYWSLAAARLGVDVRSESVRLAAQQLDEARSRVDTGALPPTAAAEPRAELERRRGELLAAGESVVRAEDALKLLVLGAVDDPLWAARLVPTDTAVVTAGAGDVEAAVEHALTLRPEIEQARAAVERRDAEAAFARNRVRPALDAVVSYDRFGLAGSANPAAPVSPLPPSLQGGLGDAFGTLRRGRYDATRVALELALPLPDRAARGGAAAARAGERLAEAELQRVRKAVRADVLDAAAAVGTAAQRIDTAHSAREAAETQLAAERDRYAGGLSTNFLVLTRQNDLSRARLDEIAARTDYRIARAELARATGTPAADDVPGEPGH